MHVIHIYIGSSVTKNVAFILKYLITNINVQAPTSHKEALTEYPIIYLKKQNNICALRFKWAERRYNSN